MERAIKIILLRHCEDVGTQLGKFEDLRLTVAGEEQATKIANNLQHLNIKYIYSSPLQRALQTAQIIEKKVNAPIISASELKDRDVGQAIGLTYKQVQLKFSSLLKQSSFGIDFKFPDGESNGDVYMRAKSFLNDLLSSSSGTDQSILIISHTLLLNYLLYILLKMDFKEGIYFKFEHGVGCELIKEHSSPNFQITNFGRYYYS